MKMLANREVIEVKSKSDIAEANKVMREFVKERKAFEVKISREATLSTYTDSLGGAHPFNLSTGDIVEPLYPKTILSAIGAPLETGLTGNKQWPVVEAFEASFAGEGVELGDTKIEASKLIARPDRMGITIPITREALTETDDLLQTIATQYMPVAIAKLMNKVMFSTKKVNGATNCVGPFVDTEMKSGNILTYAATDIDDGNKMFKKLIAVKTVVTGSDIEAEQLCYVMNEATKGTLEATPKFKNGNLPIVDGNRVNGIPVFTSSLVADGTILFGAFKYAPQGIFGDMSFIVDPYTGATKNEVRFTLNIDYAVTTLRKEAFSKLVAE